MSESLTPVKKTLSVKTKLLFATGDLTTSLPLAIQMFFQLYFLTDIVRLDPGLVGWILVIARCWDAVNDPIIGILSDRLKTRWGRRRALLAFGSIPLGVFFALSWVIPPLSDFGLAVYFTLMIIAFDSFYTIVHVGFNALTPTMTYDYDERSSLNGYRMVFSLCGTLGAILVATLLSQFVSSGPLRFAIIGILLGALAAIPPWIVFSISKEADQGQIPSKMSLASALRLTFRNRAFVMLAGLYITSWTATSLMASMLVYYANYYMHVPKQANFFVLVAEGSAILFVPLTVALAKRFDKPKAFLMGIGFWCVVLIGLFFLPNTAVTAAYVLAFFCGPGIAAAVVIPWSMVPDVVESEQVQTGQRREGAYYSFMAFFQKLGTGGALWAVGQALAYVGYVTPTADSQYPVQPQGAVNLICWIVGPVTVTLLLMAWPFAWAYPLNRQQHARLLEQLRSNPDVPAGR